jgi:hypothetical protein
MTGEITRMWPGGPLRLFLPRQTGKSDAVAGRKESPGSWVAYKSNTLDGFAGPYVCERCQKSAAGVYRIGGEWICGTCKTRTQGKRRKAVAAS